MFSLTVCYCQCEETCTFSYPAPPFTPKLRFFARTRSDGLWDVDAAETSHWPRVGWRRRAGTLEVQQMQGEQCACGWPARTVGLLPTRNCPVALLVYNQHSRFGLETTNGSTTPVNCVVSSDFPTTVTSNIKRRKRFKTRNKNCIILVKVPWQFLRGGVHCTARSTEC